MKILLRFPLILFVFAMGCNMPAASGAPIAIPKTAPAQTPVAVPAEHRIGIRMVNGDGEFYDRVTGEKFVPRGAALWRWKQWPPDVNYFSIIDTIFNTQYGQLDSALAELPKMHEDGFNVVHLWFNACWGGAAGCLDLPGGGLNQAFLQNMARFFQVAKENGIYVILTMDALPDSRDYQHLLDPYRGQYEDFNLEFMTQGGIEAQSKYQTDLIKGLRDAGAPMDVILAYQIKEEAYFDTQIPPFSRHSGAITPANGKTYDLGDVAQRRALMEDSWVYYIQQVNGAIKAIDPTALVTMGFFVQQEPNHNILSADPRYVYLHKVLYDSDLDFVSFSSYPGAGFTQKQVVENFDLIGYHEKPVIMGEFGVLRSEYLDINKAAKALQTWQADSCEFGFDGWILWTWDGGGEIQDIFWQGMDGNGEIRRALSPALNPDPCTTGEPITTARFSGTWAGSDPDDGSVMTITISQHGNSLTGTFKDSYSGNRPPPGFEGLGEGTVLSPTTAQVTFHLSRPDGASADLTATMTLSNQNNTLTFTFDTQVTPWVFKRL